MTQKNPWQTLSTRIVYQNPWITLREDSVIRPDGAPGIYGVVETRIATGVVALSEDLQVYLVGQYRYPLHRYSWEIIEGGNEPNEPPLDAIKRELREEGGLEAKDWIKLGGVVHLSNCHSSEEAYLYLARDLKEVQAAPDGNELLQVRKVSLKECLDMVSSGEITDAMSIIGLYRAHSLLIHEGVL